MGSATTTLAFLWRFIALSSKAIQLEKNILSELIKINAGNPTKITIREILIGVESLSKQLMPNELMFFGYIVPILAISGIYYFYRAIKEKKDNNKRLTKN